MEKEGLKRFNYILDWCKEHPLKDGDVYEINDKVCKYFFDQYIGFPVSKDEIACCYKILGYNVERVYSVSYVDEHYWQISNKK